jgi:hypothetical protein
MVTRTRAVIVVGAVAVAGAALAGCARHAPPAAPVAQGPLEVPAVPPRVLAPVAAPAEPADAPPTPDDRTPPSPRRQRPRPQPKPPEPAARTEQAPETGRTETAGTPPAEAKPAEAKTVLQTPATAGDVEAERRIREVIARARHELAQVSVQGLGADARAQYDTAQRFLGQADEALKARNYMFAQYLADKADLLARGLLGR